MPFKSVEDRKAYAAAHYERKREEYAARNKKLRMAREEYVREIKESNPCVDCGQHYLACQMQFDHVSGEKVNDVSRLVRNSTIAKIKEEIAKCELVCANCHALRTWQRHMLR